MRALCAYRGLSAGGHSRQREGPPAQGTVLTGVAGEAGDFVTSAWTIKACYGRMRMVRSLVPMEGAHRGHAHPSKNAGQIGDNPEKSADGDHEWQ